MAKLRGGKAGKSNDEFEAKDKCNAPSNDAESDVQQSELREEDSANTKTDATQCEEFDKHGDLQNAHKPGDETQMNLKKESHSETDDAANENDHYIREEGRDWIYIISFSLISILSFGSRLYKIDYPKHVCWDETHFGKFANYYLNGTFFFDVHPPLGKMLLALSGWITGYRAGFPFDKPGDSYGDHNYVGMRVFCAFLGSACIPLAYLVVYELTHSIPAAVLAASLILFDTGCLTISQYILLDPILMFFVMMSVFSLLKFYSWKDSPFSIDWWGWMFCTGYFLACTFSVKWVGLFVILLAGITTVKDLWDILGDLSISMYVVTQHFMARVLGLIVVPVTVYLFFFGVHFQALPLSGPGDGFFSSAFQSTLHGSTLHKAKLPKELAFGSVVTIKNAKPGGTLLHSHHHLYPKEHPPEQQQITGYSHKDPNNDWLIKKPYQKYNSEEPLDYVKNGDVVRLEHVMTKRNLHSHNEKAPLTPNVLQVAGYGQDGEGDANDFWRIEAVKGLGEEGRILTIQTKFKLIHVNTGCALTETEKNLPKWGWEQREMGCNPITHHPNTVWNIEGHVNERVPQTSIELMAPSFLQSVYESHVVMAQVNNGFKVKEGEFASQPWHWPINFKGQVFSGGDDRVYLLGNPIIWWGILVLFALFGVVYFYHAAREQRKLEVEGPYTARRRHMLNACCWLLLGWALHYFPFYLFGRVLYFHHYFPAYLFSAMFAGIFLDHTLISIALLFKTEGSRKKVYYGSVGLILLLVFVSFVMFHGLSYGMSGPQGNDPNATYAAYKLLDSWEI